MALPRTQSARHVKALVISMQRQKTAMEITGLQEHFRDAYCMLSKAIWSIEEATGLSAPALRDEEDMRMSRGPTSGIPGESPGIPGTEP